MEMACATASSRVSFPAASSGTLAFNHKAQVALNLTQCPASTCMPTQIVKVAGCSMANLQDRCHLFLGKPNQSGRRQFSRVTCIAISDDVALDEEDNVPGKQLDGSSPSTLEVHQLLTELCDETSIAELQVKVGLFKLNVKRKVDKKKGILAASSGVAARQQVPAAVPSPPVPSKPMNDSAPIAVSGPPNSKAQLSSASKFVSSFSKPLSRTWTLLETAADEGLLFVKSPKVGYFRTGRLVKGKRGKPLLEEGQIIKEGHVVCYLEQLGTQQPVESQICGEVVKVLWDDGEPVGYGDPLIAVRPSFPGIKKLT